MPVSEVVEKAVLVAAGLESLVNTPEGLAAVERILEDHEALNLGAKAAAAAFAIEGLRKMGPEQLARLRKRVGAEPGPQATAQEISKGVRWTLEQLTVSGVWMVRAATHNQNIGFTGHPDKLEKYSRDKDGVWHPFTWQLSECPKEIRDAYKRVYTFVPLPEEWASAATPLNRADEKTRMEQYRESQAGK